MRILYVTIEDLCKTEGGKVHFWAVAKGLRNLGNEVTIISPRYSKKKIVYPEKIRGLSWWVSRKNALGVLWFELVFLLFLPWFKFRYCWDAMLVRGGGPAILGGLVFLLARLLRIRVVLECNGVTWKEYQSLGFSHLVCRVVKFGAWQHAKTANNIIGVTRGITKTYCNLARRKKTIGITIPNGVNPRLFADTSKRQTIRQNLGISQEAMVVGFVGSFAPWHGAKRLVQAMDIIKDIPVYLLMLGSGGNEVEIKKLAEDAGLEKVLFLGRVDRDEIPLHYQAMDIGTCLNVGGVVDGSPLKFFEYLAAGLFVLGSGFPQIKEIIEANQVGIFLDSPSPEEIAQTIRKLYQYPDQIIKVRQQNITIAKEKYSWSQVSQQVADILANKQ